MVWRRFRRLTSLYDRSSDSMGVRLGSWMVRAARLLVWLATGEEGRDGELTPDSGGNSGEREADAAAASDGASSMSMRSRKGCVECE
jgi:hypothetical protein